VLSKSYYDEGSGKGVDRDAELLLDPDLQERSSLPYDTGSDRRVLEVAPPGLDFSALSPGWPSKEGVYSDDNAVNDKARKVRGDLRERIVALRDSERRDVVCCHTWSIHEVFVRRSGD
jgi:hypothetical protein